MQQPKSATPRRPRRTRQQWAEIVARHDESGLAIQEFCERENLAYTSFIKWRTELAGKQHEAPTSPSFVELTARESVSSQSDCLIELCIGSSITLTIRPAG